jgi:inhibitor of KinA sporulation pathway (predicted exonuclease)
MGISKMKFLSFDLELNQASTGAKIIEVGACIGETDRREVLTTYSCLVNPHEILEPTIIALTGITQEEVYTGKTIEEAYLGMEKLANYYDCLRMPLVWGCGDGYALRAELSKDTKWNFSRRELDVKAIFQAYQVAIGGKLEAGLSKAMRKVGLTFQGKKHRAKDDAVNTFLIFCELLQKFQGASNINKL